MQTVEALFHRLHTEEPSDALRTAIIDLIAETLVTLRADLGYWEKVHVAEAIACVYYNLGQGLAPRRAWLALALTAIEKATVPTEERSESYTKADSAIDALRYEDLAKDLRRLGATVPH